MATIWLLISVSAATYNYGTLSSVEFTTEEKCNSAKQQLEYFREVEKYTRMVCVPK